MANEQHLAILKQGVEVWNEWRSENLRLKVDPERRVEEQERERIFRRHGIKVVERFDSSRCYENPDEVVQEFFKMLEIGYS